MPNILFCLGAPDPEMALIQKFLEQSGIPFVPAMKDGRRVRPNEAYSLHIDLQPVGTPDVIYAVECDFSDGTKAILQKAGIEVRHIDHHRPGDPGYGKPPADFLKASSIGQVFDFLAGLGLVKELTREVILTAAADHCLAAAYRGECPGVDPDELMAWRLESRSQHQKRSIESILDDIEEARKALHLAPRIRMGDSPNTEVADLRGFNLRELPEASAREGIAFLGMPLERLGERRKVVIQSGTPDQIRAFLEVWAPANGLVDLYGDPARGLAGGQMPRPAPTSAMASWVSRSRSSHRPCPYLVA